MDEVERCRCRRGPGSGSRLRQVLRLAFPGHGPRAGPVSAGMFTYDLYICFMLLSSPQAIQQRFRFVVRSFINFRMTPGYRLDWVPWTTSAEAGLRSLTHQIPCSTCSGLRRLRISRGLRIPSEEEEDRVKLPDHLQGTTRTVLAPVPQKKNRSKADSAEGVVDQLRIRSSCRNDP